MGSSVKERLIQFLETNNISKSEFGRKIGVSSAYVSSIRRSIDKDKIKSIASNYPSLNIDWLLYGEGEMIRRSDETMRPSHVFPLRSDHQIPGDQKIPLYELTATAGLVAIFQDSVPVPDSFISVPGLPAVDGAIFVRGDSMTPVLKSGDIVIYKKMELCEDSILWGQIYLLSYSLESDDFTVVKYIRHSEKDGYIRLISANDFYDPIEIPTGSITALALVKASITFHTIG